MFNLYENVLKDDRYQNGKLQLNQSESQIYDKENEYSIICEMVGISVGPFHP